MQISANDYYLKRDKKGKLALRGLINRSLNITERYDLVTLNIPEGFSTLKVPRVFHYPIIKNARFSLHKSIVLSEQQREEVWYNNNGVIFYCKTGEVYELFGSNISEINRVEKLLKKAIIPQVTLTEKIDLKSNSLSQEFLKMFKQVVDYSPDVEEFSTKEIYSVIKEVGLLGDRSCSYSASCAYILLQKGKKFNVVIGNTGKHPDLVFENNAKSVFIEFDGKNYYHDVRQKNYFGYHKKLTESEIINVLKPREQQILLEMRRTEFLAKSAHDPRMIRMKNYKKRKYEVLSIDTSQMVNYGHCKFTVKVGDYEIIVFLHTFLKTLRVHKNLLGWGTIFNYDLVRSVLPKIVDNSDIKIHCSCPDFKYRFAYWASKHGYKASYLEMRPAKIRNPHDTLGSACKHVLALMSNKEWVRNLAPAVRKVLEDNPDLIGR